MFPKPHAISQLIKADLAPHKHDYLSINQVIDFYNLGKKWKYKPIGNHISSQTFIVFSEHGKWMLKKYPEGKKPSAVNIIHSLLRQLEEQKFPSPHLKLTKSGQDYVILDDDCYAIFDFVTGYRGDWFMMSRSLRRRHIEQAALTLAYLHILAEDFLKPLNETQICEAFGSKAECNRWNKLISDTTSSKGRDPILSDMTADYIGKRLTKLATKNDEQSMSKETLIHGDYGPWNLLFGPIAVIKAVLDFDDMYLGRRVEEVAASLIPFAGRDNIRLDFEDACTFMAAYQSIAPLTADELIGLTTNFERHLLKRIVRILNRYQHYRLSKDHAKLHRKIAWLEWLEEEGEEFLHNLSELFY